MLKRSILPSLFVLFSLIGFVSESSAQYKNAGIKFFQGSWEQLLNEAKKQNKPIFLDAYAVWCGPCHAMSRGTFKDAEVGKYFNNNFINYKLDMEKGEGPMLQQSFKVTAYPTLLFIQPDGTIKHRAVGYRNPQQLLSAGQQALNKLKS